MDDSQSQDPAKTLPAELIALLEARDDARDDAWAAFIDKYSRLILHAAKSLGKEYDPVMDRYVYALEQLRQDDFRRLRKYVADGRGRFSTWLTVVVRRLCLDHHRQWYGRPRGGATEEGVVSEAQVVRKRLVDLVAARVDLSRIGDPSSANPERELRSTELAGALAAALSDLLPRDRMLLAMRFEDDLPAREIADVMGFPTPFHVYRRVNSLLASLRGQLERRGIEDSEP